MSYAKELNDLLVESGANPMRIKVTEEASHSAPSVTAEVALKAPGLHWTVKELRTSAEFVWIIRNTGIGQDITQFTATRVVTPDVSADVLPSAAYALAMTGILVGKAVTALNEAHNEQQAENLRAHWHALRDAFDREERLRQRGAVTNVAATITTADADSFREQLKRGPQIEREDAV